MAVTTVQEFLDQVVNVDSSKIEGIDGVFLFDLSGEDGGKWALVIKDGKIEVEEGGATPPDVTISMLAQDLIAMVNGELNAVAAFMQGKIKVSGDMTLAMRMQSLLT